MTDYNPEFKRTVTATVVLAVFLTALSLTTAFIFPNKTEPASAQNVISFDEENTSPVGIMEISFNAEALEAPARRVFSLNESRDFINEVFDAQNTASGDIGLDLYRNPQTKAVVEWFYFRFTGNRQIALTIIEAADRENIPLPLAFALCHTESRFKATARNTNTNGTVDRGLFQLNDKTFPHLEEDDFFAPETSARYGMKHLAWCRKIAGDDLVAAAMYNAGVGRVKANQTPKSTLIYVSKIADYKASIERQFTQDVLKCLSDQTTPEFDRVSNGIFYD